MAKTHFAKSFELVFSWESLWKDSRGCVCVCDADPWVVLFDTLSLKVGVLCAVDHDELHYNRTGLAN